MTSLVQACRYIAAVGVALGALSLASPGFCQARKTHFNIPAQDLSASLKQYASLTGLQVIFPSSLAKDLKAPALRGDFTTDEALKIILSNASLDYEVSDGVLLIHPRSPAIAAVVPQAPTPRRGPPPPVPFAQPRPPADQPPTVVVVTGYRQALEESTEAKRRSLTFGDTIFASDVGKFPDVNIAESLQRMPGTQLQRNGYTGEGITVSVRGLGPSFTTFTLNGAAFQVASNGDGFATEADREVDLNLFPSDLFTKLSVSRSPVASQLEGGVAGNVDLRTARPFDNKGTHLNYNVYQNYNQISGKWAPRAAVVASKTWDRWGVLAGLSYFKQDLRSDYYQPQELTDVNLSSLTSDPQGPTAQSVNGSNGYVYPSTVPASYDGIQGLVGGTPVTLAYLQLLNPGQSVDQLKGALLPRLGTVQSSLISTDRYASVVSVEYRPSAKLRFALDLTGGISNKRSTQYYLSWFVRNSGGMIPINQKVDANNVVTSGTYVGATRSSGDSLITEKLWFYNINPEMSWSFNDVWSVSARGNFSRSGFLNFAPQFLTQTAPSVVDVVTYMNNGGVPSIKSKLNVNDPASPQAWFAARVSKVRRFTENRGVHIDFTYKNGKTQFLMGFAHDFNRRTNNSYNNDSNYTNYVNGPSSPVPSVSLNQYLRSVDLRDFMSLIPGSNANANFVIPDPQALALATNAAVFVASAPLVSGSGTFEESTNGAYFEYRNRYLIFKLPTTVDFGLRHISTRQFVLGTSIVNGQLKFTPFTTQYSENLPSFNAVMKVASNINLRFAASKTMTRASPSSFLPAVVFTDPGGSVASKGNANLKPYLSDNLDFGGEYYTGRTGYVGFDAFHKRIINFLVPITTGVHLADLGLTMNDISVQQQAAINLQGGPNVAPIQLSTTINSPSPVSFTGYEFNWVQPLDAVVPGLGFSANYTNLATRASLTTLRPTNVPRYMYNLVGYYENRGVSLHVSYNYVAAMRLSAPPIRNTYLANYQAPRGQLDLSLSYKVCIAGRRGAITLDATNLTKAPFRQYFGYSNAANQTFNPGLNVMIGWRGGF